jgi:2-beta-glucuronyltransferase
MKAEKSRIKAAEADRAGLPTCAKAPFLVISRHDFRSPRKANMHFIAEELARHGPTRFFPLALACYPL